jgi:phosphoadenosine phosphosulfate reductase
MLNKETIQKLESASLNEALEISASLFPGQVAFSSSLGQEDQVITDAVFRNNIGIKIFTIDTGRLFNETYELIEKTHARYNQSIQVFFPEAKDVETFVAEKGINSFYESTDNRKECCHIRKVIPLNRALQGVKIWITGLRAEQSANRQDMKMLEWDNSRQMYKFNPLLYWKYEEVVAYINQFNVPYNVLHDKGYISIGCAPCTRAIEPGEDPRAGRWWWETSQKECGLHAEISQRSE